MRSAVARSLAFLVAVAPAWAGSFIPDSVTDQTATAPLANPVPTNCDPRYISGFGSNNEFSILFEDRSKTNLIAFVSTTTGPTGFQAAAVSCVITDTHLLVKQMPITVNGTAYQYRAWASVGNNRDHKFYVANELTNWVVVSTFWVTNAVGFTPDEFVYYGFHDVMLINGTYYGWGEGNGGGTMMIRSPTGADNWEAFAGVGGVHTNDGPLLFTIGGGGPTPSGSFVDLGYGRGFGKIYMGPARDAWYLAVNTQAKASLPPAEFEAAFIQPTNWTWNNGTVGVCTSVATPILVKTAEHDLRECWTVPNTDPAADWVIVYAADFGSGDGGIGLGYATLTPPSPGAVHNVTKDLYYDTIQAGINDADEWDFIRVAPGPRSFVLNKRLTIEGSGSTDNPAVSTVVTGGTPTIQLQVGGTSATDRVELRNLYVTGGEGGVPLNENSGVEIQGTADIGHVTFSNVTFVGNAGCGIAVDFSYNLSDIAVRDCVFQSNTYYGIRLPSGLNSWDFLIEGCLFTNNLQGGIMSYAALTNIVVRDSTFAGNASGVDQLGEIVLSPFNGDAVFEDLSFLGNNADAAIRITGSNTLKRAGGPAGDITFSNVTFGGTYSHAAIQISRYTTAASITFSGVELSTESPVGLHMGTVDGNLDIDAIIFSGTNSQGNIVLGRHGDGYATPSTYSNATVGVDATEAIFTGAANNWEIEDRIVHGPDIGALGTVKWVTGSVFVTPDSGSVGRGVEAASAGDTVIVAPGIYTERVTGVISAPMTVRSEGGDCGSGVVLTGTNGILRIADGVSGVTIQGFLFQGVTGGDCISGDAPVTGQNNVTIISNCFEDIEYAAIAGEGNAGPNTRTNWLVAANLVDGVTGLASSGFRFVALQDSRITGNTVQDIAGSGMDLEGLADVEISGNTIVNANTNNTGDRGGLVVHPDAAGVMVSDNFLNGNNNGFVVPNVAGAVGAGIQVTANNIYGNNGYGAANYAQGGGTLDAESNWWGSYAGRAPWMGAGGRGMQSAAAWTPIRGRTGSTDRTMTATGSRIPGIRMTTTTDTRIPPRWPADPIRWTRTPSPSSRSAAPSRTAEARRAWCTSS